MLPFASFDILGSSKFIANKIMWRQLWISNFFLEKRCSNLVTHSTPILTTISLFESNCCQKTSNKFSGVCASVFESEFEVEFHKKYFSKSRYHDFWKVAITTSKAFSWARRRPEPGLRGVHFRPGRADHLRLTKLWSSGGICCLGHIAFRVYLTCRLTTGLRGGLGPPLLQRSNDTAKL